MQAIDLKSSLVIDPVVRPYPLCQSERTGHILPSINNAMQSLLIDLSQSADQKLMKIKEKKTNIMKFNFSINWDFPPEVYIPGFKDQIMVISETRLLGLVITDDLKWAAYTQYICSMSYKRMWRLRRMKILDVDPNIILDVYVKEIRSILELAVPVWHSGLTRQQSADIERVQKVAVHIILNKNGQNHLSYDSSLAILNIERLERRRTKLCINFTKKCLTSRHRNMFLPNPSTKNTRNRKFFAEQKVNSERAFMSPLVYLTRLLNNC